MEKTDLSSVANKAGAILVLILQKVAFTIITTTLLLDYLLSNKVVYATNELLLSLWLDRALNMCAALLMGAGLFNPLKMVVILHKLKHPARRTVTLEEHEWVKTNYSFVNIFKSPTIKKNFLRTPKFVKILAALQVLGFLFQISISLLPWIGNKVTSEHKVFLPLAILSGTLEIGCVLITLLLNLYYMKKWAKSEEDGIVESSLPHPTRSDKTPPLGFMEHSKK